MSELTDRCIFAAVAILAFFVGLTVFWLVVTWLLPDT
jgi:nitrogen fixation-related uncharacterized protein